MIPPFPSNLWPYLERHLKKKKNRLCCYVICFGVCCWRSRATNWSAAAQQAGVCQSVTEWVGLFYYLLLLVLVLTDQAKHCLSFENRFGMLNNNAVKIEFQVSVCVLCVSVSECVFVCARASDLLLNLVWFGVQHSWVPLVSCCPLGCPLPLLLPALLFFWILFSLERKKAPFTAARSPFLFGWGRNRFDWRFAGLCNHRQRCISMIYDFALFLLGAAWLPWCFEATLLLLRFLFICKISTWSPLGSHWWNLLTLSMMTAAISKDIYSL